ncbi:glycosyltransferase family 4 protein [Pararobbsia silviterrae]|uniref:Glycosyltransferase family 4 protein n=1 Tax=Pararobbsia silviterrae TaxID=1792498 RepID=A0A494X3P4_9BURK|nr:glycosyltransferase family 4 protein [Pararobbsia silviterrae]RKP45315.1 glycosyltransferase family 4 protein [Pararobbsia silviterrae]
MKVAIVHDWLVTYAGAERVLEQIVACFPDADLFSVVDFLDDDRAFILGKRAKTTFIQRLPFARKHYRSYLPLMPLAIEQLDLSAYDLVISSSHAVAKGVITGPDQMHISYVHSPIRYAWDLQHQYLHEARLERGFKAGLARAILHYMRTWDTRTSNGVDFFLCNSHFIARRIAKIYRRTATVLPPPVDTDGFTPSASKEAFYLTASRMVPYKRIDLIVEAFAAMPDKKLVVIGDGPEMARIRALEAPNVVLLGYQAFDVLRNHMQRARAFVFAAEEDFGIAPLEAQACGTPVIAFGKGGVLDTIRADGLSPTGVFFEEQSIASLVAAVQRFELAQENPLTRIDAAACRAQAERFAPHLFRTAFKAFVGEKLASRRMLLERAAHPEMLDAQDLFDSAPIPDAVS